MGEIDRRGLGVTTSGLLIALLSIILRFAIRLRKRITPGADDWMAFVALIFYAGFCVPTLWVISQGGLGVEIQEMTPAHAQTAAKASYLMPILSIPAISFAKISILCLYHQIFVTPQFRRWVLIVGSTVVAWMVACLLATSMRCLPPKALWDPSVQGRHIDFVLFFQCIEPINCLQDLIIGLMPIYPVQRLHLGRKQKVSLCLIFLLGAMVAVISLVRIIIVSTPNATPATLYTSSEWLVIQLWLAILCANMLTYRPLLPDGSITDSLANLVKNISSKWSLSSRESGGYELREPRSPWPPYASYSSVEGRSEHKAKAGPSRVSEQR